MSDILLAEAERLGIDIEEHPFRNLKLKGLYTDGIIILNSLAIKNNREKRCILSEEIGHHETSTGIILDLNDIRNCK